MRRTFVTISAAAALIALGLTGCSHSGGDVANTPSPTVTSQASTETTRRPVTTTTAPTTTSTTIRLRGQAGEVSLDAHVMIPEHEAKVAEIVMFGTIVQIDPWRWNSLDGKEYWPQDMPMAIPAMYQTFYVEPIEMLKGAPRFGVPVAFMLTPLLHYNGIQEGGIDGPLVVGDQVLVYGHYDQQLYSPGVYWKEDAYFPLTQEYSILLFDGVHFTNLGAPDMTSLGGYTVNGFTLEEARSRIAAAIIEAR